MCVKSSNVLDILERDNALKVRYYYFIYFKNNTLEVHTCTRIHVSD